jgi:hypothetical protein
MRSATTTTTFVPFALLLAAEAVALVLGQRRLFGWRSTQTGSRLLGYLLAMPGTVLHESAHYLACVLLQCRSDGRFACAMAAARACVSSIPDATVTAVR